MNGRAGAPDANPEFSGEIAVSQCGPRSTQRRAAAPLPATSTFHFVVTAIVPDLTLLRPLTARPLGSQEVSLS